MLQQAIAQILEKDVGEDGVSVIAFYRYPKNEFLPDNKLVSVTDVKKSQCK